MMRRDISLRSLLNDVGGVSAVEFAIIAPVLLAFVVAILGYGQMLWTHNTLQYAVEQAVRCAVISPSTCGTSTQIQNYAVSKAYGLTGLAASVFPVGSASCGTPGSASLPYTISNP